MLSAKEVLEVSPIIPVIAIDDAAQALALAKALQEGGINIMEITLRTEAALESIEIIAKELPSMCVGAGTVLNGEDLKKVHEAGAKFAISPGIVDSLLETSKAIDIPLIPGVATAGEIMRALEAGLHELKLFPANIVGGVGALKAFGGPFSNLMFCPTGGINIQNMKEYLALKNVACVGGSWIASKELINAGDFSAVTALCKEALERVYGGKND